MFKDLTLSEIYNKETPFESLVPGAGIVLIGRAQTGPSMVPVKVNEMQDAIMTFGIDSELANGYIEASMNGASDVYLVRINGSHAETDVQNIIRLCSLNATTIDNSLQYEVITSGQDRYLTLLNPATSYNSSYYLTGKTISQVVSEINVDAVTFQSPVYASVITEGSTDLLVDEYFSNGQTDGAETDSNSEENMARIVEVLETLDAYPIGQVGILCSPFYAVYTDGYIYAKLTEFTERKSRACTPCIVTIGTDLFSIEANAVYDLSGRFVRNIQTECPVSEFINVVLARPIFPNLHPSYVSNGVASYCGLINSVDYYEGITNKTVSGATEDAITLTTNQKAELANLGYVVFTVGTFYTEKQVRVLRSANLTKAFNKVVSQDSTGYTRYIPAPMSDIANVKLLQYIIYQLNDVLQTEELSKISTLRARITEVLDAEVEYIRDYKIDVTESYEGFARTYVVGVEITPVGEVNGVTLTMQTR